MAIVINDQYRLRQENYLDDRQGIAESVSSLKSWDFENVPIPSGFEVFVDGVWYIFKVEFEEDETTGKFRRVTDELGIEGLEERVEVLEVKESQLEFDNDVETAPTFADILTTEFWTDDQEELHIRLGKRVTVTSDSDTSKNGVWYLVNSDYQQSGSWVKLISRADLIKTTDTTTPSDENVYTAANVDKIFPKKAGDEVVSGRWTFTDTATFEKDITITSLGTIHAVNLQADNSELDNATIHNLDADRVNIENEEVENLKVRRDAEFFGGSYIKRVDGRSVAKFDKLIAEETDIRDIDEKIEEKLGFIGVSNLLLNTSFSGQSLSERYDEDTNLDSSSHVFSDQLDNWVVTDKFVRAVSNPNSIAGFFVYLYSRTSAIAQTTPMNLQKGGEYVLSWKTNGIVTVTIDEISDLGTVYILPRTRESEYKTYFVKFTTPEDEKVTVRFTGGPCCLGEIKLEEGVIPTTWFPSLLDVDPVAKLIFKYEYLNTAFEEYTENNDDTVSSVLLKNQIKIGEYINGKLEKIYGGISGIVGTERDVMIWSGSSFRNAQSLLYHVYQNPSYLDNLSQSELQKLSKFIVTFGSKVIASDFYGVGKFKGILKDNSGRNVRAFNVVNGKIPYSGTTLIFKDGILVDEYDVPRNATIGRLIFRYGICNIDNPSDIITILTGISEMPRLYLRFDEGYLVKVSKDDNITSYYWY